MHDFHSKIIKFLFFATVVLSVYQSIGVSNQQLEYGYGPTDGPAVWPRLFPQCADGPNKRQSPINIPTAQARSAQFLPIFIPNLFVSRAELENHIHTIVLKFPSELDRPLITGGPLFGFYKFEEAHFHWGPEGRPNSEHRINGVGSVLEMHLIFYNARYRTFRQAIEQNQKDALVVFGVFVQIGATNDAFRFTEEIRNIVTSGSSTHINFSKFFNSLLPTNLGQYYTYEGSLTTPPCSEFVTWIVFRQPIQISHTQFERFRTVRNRQGALITHNNRPQMNVNNRLIRYPIFSL